MLVTGLRAAFLCAFLAIGATHAQQLKVDCDAGDDLAQALQQAVTDGLTWIAVEGTCEGSFEIAPSRSIQIEGRNATLVAPEDETLFLIRGTGLVTLEGFEIRSGSPGVLVVGPGARGAVRHCDVHDNLEGLSAVDGAQLSVGFSDVHDNDSGIFCSNSTCFASFSTIRDNRLGARISRESDFHSFGSEFSRNTESGVIVSESSTGLFDQSILLKNGSVHLVVADRSHVRLESGTSLGAPGDGTPLALATGMLSSVTTSRFGDPAQLFGDILGADSSYLILDAAQVTGDVEVYDFAELKIVRSTIDGTVSCRSGGDAVCGEGSTALIRSCPSAPTQCRPALTRPRGRRDAILDNFRHASPD